MNQYSAMKEDSEHIEMTRWGTDHWSTLLYLESVVVDNEGKVNNNKMRCHPRLHRKFAHHLSGEDFPGTRVQGGVIEQHDDWSCVEDMVLKDWLLLNGIQWVESLLVVELLLSI